MRDMFYNYDNNIDHKEYPEYLPEIDEQRILESDATIDLITDIKGNELGIAIKQNREVYLYFVMEGHVCNSSIEELVLNSMTINFEVLDHLHTVQLVKEFLPSEAYIGDNTIKITLLPNDLSELHHEPYRMRLSLIWAGGSYELFGENNAILAIK